MPSSHELDLDAPFGTRRLPRMAGAMWRAATWPWPPRVKRRLRRLARRRPGPFDVTVDGLRFRAYPAENYCDRVLVGQGRLPEPSEHAALCAYLAAGMTFVDIGANVGAYSVFVGHHAPGAAILAFEPHPRTSAKLRFNLAANGIEAQVIEAAVGPAVEGGGRMDLWSDGGGNIGHTSLLPQATSNAKVKVSVPVVPLAEALAERGIERVDVLKIDVEGFEDRALAPFLEAAPDALLPRAILLEHEHSVLWRSDLASMLAERDYRTAFESGQNRLHVRP